MFLSVILFMPQQERLLEMLTDIWISG